MRSIAREFVGCAGSQRALSACPLTTALLSVAIVAAAVGCGGNAVSFSGPVDITLPALQSKSVSPGGALSTSKDVSTAGGNPYGAFVNAAVQHLGGKNPSRIVVTSLTLSMVSTPAGLMFDQVFSGPTSITFVMNGSGNTYPVGSINGPNGAGPVSLTVAFDSKSMSSTDYTAFLGDQFKVVLDGTSTSGPNGFNSTNATSETATIDATFGFTAYE
jgi:hypothetical protein